MNTFLAGTTFPRMLITFSILSGTIGVIGYCIFGTGIIAAIVQKLAFPALHEWQAFIAVGTISVIGMIVTTLLTAPTSGDVLTNFYLKTRPFGVSNHVSAKLNKNHVRLVKQENRRDLIALLFAVPWQISLFLVPVFLVIHNWKGFLYFHSLRSSLLRGFISAGSDFWWTKNRINRATRQQTC